MYSGTSTVKKVFPKIASMVRHIKANYRAIKRVATVTLAQTVRTGRDRRRPKKFC